MSKTFHQDLAKLKSDLREIEKKFNRLRNIINTSTTTSMSYWREIRDASEQLYDESKITFQTWTASKFPKHYKEQIRKQIEKIKKMEFKPRVDVGYSTFINKNINKQTVEYFTQDAIENYFTGLGVGERRMNRLISATQQNLIRESRIQKLVAEGESFNKIQTPLLKELQQISDESKYITIINRNGKPMNFKLDTYAEMVARTEYRNLQTGGTVNLAAEYNNDLVQVSAHNTLTPYDAQFEGKVYSLSGKSKFFPAAFDLPPFHPNCIHTISIYFLEAQPPKTAKEISDFSLGKTEKHPTLRSHIPVSERKI